VNVGNLHNKLRESQSRWKGYILCKEKCFVSRMVQQLHAGKKGKQKKTKKKIGRMLKKNGRNGNTEEQSSKLKSWRRIHTSDQT